MNAYIFCWSESSVLPYKIEPDDLVIAADSGFLYAQRCGVAPDIVLGDFDSMDADKIPGKYDKITLPREKDETDAMYAVRVALDRGCKGVYLVGGSGGRLDHTLGALSVIRYAAARCDESGMDDGYTSVKIIKSGEKFRIKYDPAVKYISLFPSGASVRLTVKGLRYTLDGYMLRTDDAVCVSNEFVPGRDGEVFAEDGDAIIIEIKTP